MTTHWHRQRGAVTLLGALFIVITLALMVQVLNRMAASEILDTAQQNDAVEALFVAETGIEHASFLYANGNPGTACIDLDGVSASAGRGNFAVSAPVLVGSDCRIQVTGAVSSNGSDQARRTVEADLRLSSGGGWAVGDNGSLLSWDGANWTSVASGTTNTFNGIHCATANDCWAVGDQVIASWDGSNWTVQSHPNIDLSAVSCDPDNPSYCVAIGSFFGINSIVCLRTVGPACTITDSTIGPTYQDIDCPNQTCYITATSGAIYRYNPALTPRLADDSSGTTVSMNGIDCTSGVDCWAVGNRSGNDFIFNQRTSTGWTGDITLRDNNDREDLNAISCADANNCKAVGVQKGSRYTVVSYDGSNWSVESLTDTTNRADLNAVHCVAADDCWAVGDLRSGWSIIRYDGVGWAYTGSTAANPENLNDIYISGSGGGSSAVTLVRWREIVSN